MILAFPLSVLATNRILDTPISRNGTANSFRPLHMYKDLIALMRLGGHRTLFAGLIPTMIFYMYQDTQKKRATDAQGLSTLSVYGMSLSDKYEMNKNRLFGTGPVKEWKDL